MCVYFIITIKSVIIDTRGTVEKLHFTSNSLLEGTIVWCIVRRDHGFFLSKTVFLYRRVPFSKIFLYYYKFCILIIFLKDVI